MRVFRATYKTRDGKRKEAAKWYVEFRDHLDTVRRLPGFTDKKQSEELGRKIEKLVACRANGDSPDTTMSKWLEAMPGRVRKRLAAIGLLDARRVAAGKPLSNHLGDFEATLAAKGNSEKHVRLTTGRIRRVLDGCGFRYWTDLSASKVQRYLAELRDRDEFGIQTSNYHLQAVKQFTKWMVLDRRASDSPFDYLQRQNAEPDRRRDRRPLTPDESRWLLSTVAAGPNVFLLSGSERHLVYRLALEAGLRASEIWSLTRASFDFDADSPTVTVQAGYSKRRRVDVLPLRSDLAEALKTYLGTKLPQARAFRIPKSDKTAKMLRTDLRKARAEWIMAAVPGTERRERKNSDFLKYRDETGRVADFHALRHTFITNLANSGTHPKVAQLLARHSTITLTMDRYTHSMWEQLGDALERLPDISRDPRQLARATGTTGGQERLARCLAPKGPFASVSMHRDAMNDSTARGAEKRENPRDNPTIKGNSGGSEEEAPPGFEPGMADLQSAALAAWLRRPEQIIR